MFSITTESMVASPNSNSSASSGKNPSSILNARARHSSGAMIGTG